MQLGSLLFRPEHTFDKYNGLMHQFLAVTCFIISMRLTCPIFSAIIRNFDRLPLKLLRGCFSVNHGRKLNSSWVRRKCCPALHHLWNVAWLVASSHWPLRLRHFGTTAARASSLFVHFQGRFYPDNHPRSTSKTRDVISNSIAKKH